MNYLDYYSNNMKAVNNTKITEQQTPPKYSVQPKKENDEQDKSKKLKLALAGLAAAGIATIAVVYNIKKGKSVKLSDIKFEKGIASLKKSKSKYTGKIKDTLKNGDKIILNYENGILKSSSRSGQKNFHKIYKLPNGEKIVNILENGEDKLVNITKITNEAKVSNDKLKKLLSDNSNLSPTEFLKQTSEIKYKNNNQQVEINNIVKNKEEIIRKQSEYEKVNKKLEDITFEKGIAKYNGNTYKGKVHCKLKNGDKAVLEYDINGKLIKSERTGSKNFVKEYNNHVLGTTVKITENGTEKRININALKEEALNKKQIAKELAQKAEIEERIKSELDDFSSVISKKSDEDIEAIQKEILSERNNINIKASNLYKKNYGVDAPNEYSSLNMLSIEERQKYDLLEKKIDYISREKEKRKFDYLHKIIHKTSDKPLQTKHSNTYLNSEECRAFNRYYDDETLNYKLRQIPNYMTDDIKLMDNSFNKAPALTEEATVYRAIGKNIDEASVKHIDSIKEGKILYNAGFTSTSTNCKNGQFSQFASSIVNGSQDGYIMRIKLPIGTKGVLGGYDEYLLPRNAQIKVVKINNVNGVKIADCEYILPH